MLIIFPQPHVTSNMRGVVVVASDVVVEKVVVETQANKFIFIDQLTGTTITTIVAGARISLKTINTLIILIHVTTLLTLLSLEVARLSPLYFLLLFSIYESCVLHTDNKCYVHDRY